MSHNETAAPSPKISIMPSTTPAPPWTGVKFTCETSECRAEYQLEAADECRLRLILNDTRRVYDTPPCWDCGLVSVIDLPSEKSESSAVDEFQEGNAS